MTLTSLLEAARAAPPEHRIEFRDAIAAHGAGAVEGVRPWLADPGLAAFAVRVIERVGVNGEAQLAGKVLRASRRVVPEAVAPDIAWSLERLRTASRPSTAAPAAPAAPASAQRAPARSAPAARGRPR